MADTIRRTKRTGNFTTVRNEYLQDVNLSWKAKGLITYIMSLPPDWQLNLSDLKNRSKDGRDATAAGLRELITNTGSQALIEVDGGVNLETGRQLVEAGADVLVAGNAVFKAPDMSDMIHRLKSL